MKTNTMNPLLKSVEGTTPREVKFDLTDNNNNEYRLTFKKNAEGDYKLSCHGQAYSNFQIKYPIDDLEWIADDGKWSEVNDMINSGVKVVMGVKWR